ncbi:S8 family peptidase [Halobacillus yeomjeoni]|uniref:S8 family serine peptidase n=1 Tax=Halobacillus yeomjeoni TaxID=311194 RepID=A0A931HYY6_9BACI|nr:S8 family serine peptidase [Halobacillus yeomjeoni]MBH0231716.1 S8 family serine peptidase [Halobacillus yeomjeoni]
MKLLSKLSFVFILVLASFLPFHSNKAEASVLKVDVQLVDLLDRVKDSTETEAIITYETNPTIDQLDLLKSFGLTLKTFSELPVVGVQGTALQIENLINSQIDAVSIHPNKDLEYLLRDSRELVGVERVWQDLGYTGKGTTVAVIDSGVDGTHPDLPFGSKVIQNVQLLVGGGLFGDSGLYLENVPNTDTSSGHGTHVAGTIAGLGEASDGLYKGVAPDAKIVGIGAGEGISVLWALEGFNYAIEHQQEYGIDVISNSWGTTGEYDPNDPINVASKTAHDKGMTVTFAAGNSGPEDNTLNPYSAAPWVISVAAGTKDKQLADFSSRGVAGDPLLHPDITAPGVDIVATKSSTGFFINTLGATKDINYIAPQHIPFYTTASGTSMATPHISGIIALMEEANPGLTPDEALNLLQNTAEPMAGYEYHEVGAGYVDAFKAVQQAEQGAAAAVK